MTNLLGQIESGPAKLCGQFAGLPLLDDIRLFRAVVLVDQFLVALPDQASVIRSAILRAPFADEFLEQFAVFRLQLVCGEQSETERIVERVVDGAVDAKMKTPTERIGLKVWARGGMMRLMPYTIKIE